MFYILQASNGSWFQRLLLKRMPFSRPFLFFSLYNTAAFVNRTAQTSFGKCRLCSHSANGSITPSVRSWESQGVIYEEQVVTSATLVVTMFAIRNKCIATSNNKKMWLHDVTLGHEANSNKGWVLWISHIMRLAALEHKKTLLRLQDTGQLSLVGFSDSELPFQGLQQSRGQNT